jgi:hypothetical protein
MKSPNKIITGIALTALTLGILIPSVFADSFTDVSSSNENYDAIEYLYEQDIIEGYDDGTYKPYNEINRAEFTKIIIGATTNEEDIDACDTDTLDFTDIDVDDWYSPYLCVAKANEVIGGYPNGSFKPANSINFVEAAKVITLGYGYDLETNEDVWYEPYVTQLGELAAIPDSIDNLSVEISRGEMAEIIYRVDAEVTNKSSQTYEDLSGKTDPSEVDYGYGPGMLPLGSNQYSTTTASRDSVYVCNSNFNGSGAYNVGEWVYEDEGYYDPYSKVTVDGDVEWPDAWVEITLDGDERIFSSNALPSDHTTGIYPIQRSDDAYDYDRNPHSIAETDIYFTIPASPEVANSPHCVSLGAVGFAKNGVAIYNSFDAEGRDAPAYEIQDHCDGHPQSEDTYHYHSLSDCFEDSDSGHSELWGYILDGFGIYGPKGEEGTILTNDDLDACHGHTHEIEWDGETVDMYHYHVTYEFPYTIGCYKGDVDEGVLEQFVEGGGGPPQ